MLKESNALTRVKCFLASATEIDDVVNFVVGHSSVIEDNLTPSRSDIVDAFRYLQAGMEYALKKWGEHSLPKYISIPDLFYTPDGKSHKHLVGYTVESDEFIITPNWLAHAAVNLEKNRSDNVVRNYSDKINGNVAVQDFLKLIGVEECYHRYDIVVLGSTHICMGLPGADDPIEMNAVEPIRAAAKDMGIKIYSTLSGPQ